MPLRVWQGAVGRAGHQEVSLSKGESPRTQINQGLGRRAQLLSRDAHRLSQGMAEQSEGILNAAGTEQRCRMQGSAQLPGAEAPGLFCQHDSRRPGKIVPHCMGNPRSWDAPIEASAALAPCMTLVLLAYGARGGEMPEPTINVAAPRGHSAFARCIVMDNPPPCGYYARMMASGSVLRRRDRLSDHALYIATTDDAPVQRGIRLRSVQNLGSPPQRSRRNGHHGGERNDGTH
jgi:hypothetical protein